MLFPNACDKGNGRAKPEGAQSHEFSVRGRQELAADVNVVQNKIEQRHLVRSGELRSMVKGKLSIAVKTGDTAWRLRPDQLP